MHVLVYYCPFSVMLDEHIFFSFDLICWFKDSLFDLRPILDQLHYTQTTISYFICFSERKWHKRAEIVQQGCPSRGNNMFTVTLLNALLIPCTRLCPVPLRRMLRRHLYLRNLALHLCPLDLPGSFVIGVGLLQLAPLLLLFLQLLSKLLQQRSKGLQHFPILFELHKRLKHKPMKYWRSKPIFALTSCCNPGWCPLLPFKVLEDKPASTVLDKSLWPDFSIPFPICLSVSI